MSTINCFISLSHGETVNEKRLSGLRALPVLEAAFQTCRRIIVHAKPINIIQVPIPVLMKPCETCCICNPVLPDNPMAVISLTVKPGFLQPIKTKLNS